MKKIKIGFSGFWKGFNPNNNYFTRLLEKHFIIEISQDPDFLIFSCFSNDYLLNNKSVRIFFTAENKRIDFRHYDYAFGFDYINDTRYLRLPLYVLYVDLKDLVKNTKSKIDVKPSFCNFIYSNDKAKNRIEFFRLLSKYKPVDSGGKVLNNIGYQIPYGDLGKLNFIRNYKFTIAFENESYPGYTTEKIVEPMLVNSIPIYYGNPLVHKDFNSKSFVNVHDYTNYNEVIDFIIEIDRNDDLYNQILAEPWLNNNKVPESIGEERVLEKFDYIFSHGSNRFNSFKRWDKVYYFKLEIAKRNNRFSKSIITRTKQIFNN